MAVSPEHAALLGQVLSDPRTYDFDRAKACVFQPDVAVRFTRKSESRVVVFCFSCDELKVFAENQRNWRFDGVDPSAEMLKLAGSTLGPLITRVHLHHGYIDVAPEGPFDAAACLLTLHFVPLEERLRTVREIRRRLKPGSPLVVAHLSVPRSEKERSLWLSRYLGFAGIEPEKAANARATIDAQLPILAPEQDEAILRDGGFTNVSLFYVAFAFRGWVAYAGAD